MRVTLAYGFLMDDATVKEHSDYISASHLFVKVASEFENHVVLGITISETDKPVIPLHYFKRKLNVLQEAQYQQVIEACPIDIRTDIEGTPDFHILISS